MVVRNSGVRAELMLYNVLSELLHGSKFSNMCNFSQSAFPL